MHGNSASVYHVAVPHKVVPQGGSIRCRCLVTTLSCFPGSRPGATLRSMPTRDLVLLAYDIAHDARRTRALNAVRGFGIEGQLSVHECRLSAGERHEIWRRLVALVAPDDRLLMLRLDPRSRIETLGTPRAPLSPVLHYIG